MRTHSTPRCSFRARRRAAGQQPPAPRYRPVRRYRTVARHRPAAGRRLVARRWLVSGRGLVWGRRLVAALALVAMLGVCLPVWALPWTLHWPWHHGAGRAAASASAPTVQAIAVAGAASAVGQSWDSSALLLDLTRQSGQGGATLTRLPGAGWPMRLEFRVRPGAMVRLEVQGAQRVVFSVPAQGAPLVLRLDPGVYVTDTAQITLQWSAAAG